MGLAEDIKAKFSTQENFVSRKICCLWDKCELLIFPDLSDTQTVRSIVFSLCGQQAEHVKSLEEVKSELLYECESEIIDDTDEALNKLLSGDVLLCVGDEARCLCVNARYYGTRAITEPPTETVMRGPREGFIEDIRTNLSLLERRLKTAGLAIERIELGRRTQTSIAVCYISDIAAPHVVERVMSRLNAIDIDGITDSHYLAPFIEENPYSLFPQTGMSEKPDVVAAKLLEGRVAIIVDGSPMVMTVPFVLVEDFQSGDDYYQRSSFATFLRVLRYTALIVAMLLPALYVAMQNFHYTLFPVRFMITLMTAIKGLPMSPLAETVCVLLLFETIREASVRMPRSVGMALSIVGALVLGETAVNAGVISSPAVMVTALSSIALYIVPDLVGTSSVLRLLFTLVGGLTGLYGLILAVLFTLYYICALNGYGAPYLAPFSPLIYTDLQDSIERAPLRTLKKRPRSIPNINGTRQA